VTKQCLRGSERGIWCGLSVAPAILQGDIETTPVVGPCVVDVIVFLAHLWLLGPVGRAYEDAYLVFVKGVVDDP
jgi:hypothetical protein